MSALSGSRRRAVFLDRDGVLNESVLVDGVYVPPADAASMRFFPGVAEAVKSLRSAGWLCIGVTNQPDVARGTRSRADVEAMNARAVTEVGLDDLFVCFHDTVDHCRCRKPKPGMILDAAERWSIDVANSWMIGDRETDVLAGKAAGCRTVRIAPDGVVTAADVVWPDVFKAAEWILASESPEKVR